MRDALRELLVDPRDRAALELDIEQSNADDVVRGTLRAADGRHYAIVRGIPRFVARHDEGQTQTSESFSYKWGRTETWESEAVRVTGRRWLLERYGFRDAGEMRAHFEASGTVLDLGCGGGYSSSLWMDDRWAGRAWVGLDISEAIDVASDRLGGLPGTHFVQGDALSLPFRDGVFDAVFSEGVLHHTPSTQRALGSATRVLRPGGEILFYVYRRKGPIREFVDDYVRDAIKDMSPSEAWEAIRPLTRLGQALAETSAQVDVQEDVPLLGIRAGRLDIQRFLYWNVAKLYWNPVLTFEENHHVNFDWYHPAYAHRQSEDEVRSWCQDLGLEIERFDVQESGLTVRARKVKGSAWES